MVRPHGAMVGPQGPPQPGPWATGDVFPTPSVFPTPPAPPPMLARPTPVVAPVPGPGPGLQSPWVQEPGEFHWPMMRGRYWSLGPALWTEESPLGWPPPSIDPTGYPWPVVGGFGGVIRF